MDGYFTIREASKMLNRPVRTIRFWVITGRMKAVKSATNYRWLVPSEEIDRLLEARDAD